MAIEINNQSGSNQVLNQQRSQQGADNVVRPAVTGEQTPASTGRGADTVSLTDTAAQLQSIEARLAEVPVVDSQRVDSIRQALNDGAYEINAGSIADKLLAFESSLYK